MARPASPRSCPVPGRPLSHSILPVHIHISNSACWCVVLMVRTVFPRHSSISRDLYELELDLGAAWNRNIQEPVGIFRIEHRTDGRIEGRTPVAEFDRAACQKDVLARIRWCRVCHGKGDRSKLCGQNSELNRI